MDQIVGHGIQLAAKGPKSAKEILAGCTRLRCQPARSSRGLLARIQHNFRRGCGRSTALAPAVGESRGGCGLKARPPSLKGQQSQWVGQEWTYSPHVDVASLLTRPDSKRFCHKPGCPRPCGNGIEPLNRLWLCVRVKCDASGLAVSTAGCRYPAVVSIDTWPIKTRSASMLSREWVA